jgi:hypothetical protein
MEAIMNLFRIMLIILWAVLSIYTAIVIANHGMGLFGVFFGDITVMAWPGQFNLDFSIMLLLSAIWIAWRHQFSPSGLVLALIAAFAGAAFLTLYLFVISLQTRGDVKAMLLGPARAAG